MRELKNPSLRQLPRHDPAELIPSRDDTSILDWLKSSGRLIARDDVESSNTPREEDEFILMGEEEEESFEESEDNSV
ncbi:MAG: DUF3134 domain-containing protein [Geitlerinemataceae cyanobacterium]